MITFKSVFLSSVVLLGMAYTPGHGAPPPDNSTGEEARVTQSIKAVMRDVDDIGLVLLWNGHGANTIGTCEWQSGGIHGEATVRVDNKLTNGDNYLIFVCFNKRYEGTGLFSFGGKWSYDFGLAVDGEWAWHRTDMKRDNNPQIAYWKVMKMTPRSNGKVAISEEIPSSVLNPLRRYMDQLEEKMVANAPIARPF